MFVIANCSESGESRDPEPVEPADITGVWYGSMGPLFMIGVIVEDDNGEYYAWLMRDNLLLASIDDRPLTAEGSPIFEGILDEFSWSGSSDYGSFPPTDSNHAAISVYGSANTGEIFGGVPFGAYTYLDDKVGQLGAEVGPFTLFYYKGDASTIQDIQGKWEMDDVLVAGNTLSLAISGSGAISGSDERGNSFAGTIELRTDPNLLNAYDVSLTLNQSILMEGLAAYIVEVNTNGVVLGRTLAIGAMDSGFTHALSGIAVAGD
jgi:hypothetical protein